MKKILFGTFAGTIILFVAFSCREDIYTEDIVEIPEEILATNEWIYENMSLYYLWNEQIPNDIDYTKENDSEAYFYKLLYKDGDKWSGITDDYESLDAELIGKPVTMGYFPAFFLVGNSNIIIIVSYVYPGSAADEAGLERGDIILSINNTLLDTTNYYEMYSGKNYSAQLGAVLGNELRFTGESINLNARITTTNPAIYNKVLDIEGHKIGYLVYVEFISGENGEYLMEMDKIFNDLKNAGISDLIIDLRYNPGGDVDAAVHLASEIAPADVVTNEEILIKLQYNHDLQEYLEANNYNDRLYYKFINTTANINMNRIYFLTTSGTASASELLITGLDPYMEVVQIGESTYGKYAGAWVIPDDYEEWAIMPIVSKFSNADGFTDFKDGLIPDHEIVDDLSTAMPFGDTSDPMLAKAVELATGKKLTGKKAGATGLKRYKQIFPEEMFSRKNLLNTGINTNKAQR